MLAGVIGTGHLGYHHARILSELTRKTVPVYDIDRDKMERLAGDLEIRPCNDLESLLDACEAVVVATTTSSHHEVVLRALDAGVHVLVEKPLASSTAEGHEMVEKAAEKNLILAVGHVERFNPAIMAAAGLIENPMFVEGHRMAPFTERGTDVSVVFDLMIHDIDLVLSFIDSPVESVHASGTAVLSSNADIANARIGFRNGCVVNMTASRISNDRIRKLRFFQHRRYVSVDFASRTVEAFGLTDGRIEPIPVDVPDKDALTEELKDFIKACSGGSAPTVTGEDGLKALTSAQVISGKIEETFGSMAGSSK